MKNKKLNYAEQAALAAKAAEMLEAEAGENAILIMEQALHLLSAGEYRIVRGRN